MKRQWQSGGKIIDQLKVPTGSYVINKTLVFGGGMARFTDGSEILSNGRR
jgi:hypothetical protein